MTRQGKAEKLQEINFEISTLIDSALELLVGEGIIEQRAEAYWSAHIVMALTKNHNFLGGSMVTMEDTIQELKNG